MKSMTNEDGCMVAVRLLESDVNVLRAISKNATKPESDDIDNAIKERVDAIANLLSIRQSPAYRDYVRANAKGERAAMKNWNPTPIKPVY